MRLGGFALMTGVVLLSVIVCCELSTQVYKLRLLQPRTALS
jgi:hypothetical protein